MEIKHSPYRNVNRPAVRFYIESFKARNVFLSQVNEHNITVYGNHSIVSLTKKAWGKWNN